MSRMSTTKTLLWFCFPLAMAAAATLWPLWLLLGIGWAIVQHCRKPESQKVTERNRAKAKHNERQQRIRTALQMQLAAHGLTDTPFNRAQMLQALARECRRP